MKKIVILIFYFMNIFGQVDAQDSIYYKIKPVPEIDRTNLEVTVNFTIKKNDSIVVGLIAGNYGTPNLYKYMVKFEGENGTSLKKGKKEIERIIYPNSEGDVFLKYVISFDQKQLEGSAFAPIIHKNYFDLAGCQLFLHIGDDKEKHFYFIEIIDEPKGWVLHSSIGSNPKNLMIYASFNDLIGARFGGGGESYQFQVKNKPITIIIKGNFDIPIHQIFSSVERIVKLQRDWFSDYDQPFYQVVINERNGVIAGTAIENGFVCFFGKHISHNDLNDIVAHEMFHYWLPNKIEIRISEDDVSVKHEWFSEGFTTYFARKLLMDADLLAAEEFAELFNKDILKIEDNPQRNMSYIDMVAAIKEGNFNSNHKNMAYHKGALLALNWELQLKKSNKNDLSYFILNLYKFTSDRNGTISEKEFFNFSKENGINAKADFEKYIIKGESIKLEHNIADLLGKEYKVNNLSISSFDPGFDIMSTKTSKKITNIVKGKNAYLAGLRNGMIYVRMRNSYRNDGWSLERQMIVRISIEGIEKDFEFIPLGKETKIQQIIKLN